MSEEFDHLIDWLYDAGMDLKEILDALTDECTDAEIQHHAN